MFPNIAFSIDTYIKVRQRRYSQMGLAEDTKRFIFIKIYVSSF